MHFPQELGVWAYLLLAVVVMVEGPVATLAGAFAASQGLMKPGLVFLSAACGNLLGDSLWYTLGYLGKMEWVEKYGGMAGLKNKAIQRLQNDIKKNAPKLLFIAKLTLGFTIPTLVATGLSRVPIRRWLPFLVFAETIWTGSLVLLGFHFGEYLKRLQRGVEIFTFAGSLVFIALVIAYLARHRQRSNNSEEES